MTAKEYRAMVEAQRGGGGTQGALSAPKQRRRDERHRELVEACVLWLCVQRVRGQLVIAWQNDTGVFVHKRDDGGWDVASHGYGTAGVADILGMVPGGGRMLAVEVKTGSGKLSPAQAGFLGTLNSYGGIGIECRDSVHDLEAKWKKALTTCP